MSGLYLAGSVLNELGRAHTANRPAVDNWPALMARCGMSKEQADFYTRLWYAAGTAWVRGVADEALIAVCEVIKATNHTEALPTPHRGHS